MALRMLADIWLIPMVIISTLPYEIYVPALEFLKTISAIGVPSAKNAGTSMNEIISDKFNAVEIWDFNAVIFVFLALSILVVCAEISGTIATAIEEINVPGMVIKGSAIPVTIPNSAIACASVKPKVVRRRGIINEISIVTILDAVRVRVIDELSLIVDSISPLGFESLFPALKYIIETSILENTQATESENVAFTPLSIPFILIMSRIIKHIIRINCSKNSEKLIAKNFFCPQSEPLSIE